MDEMLAIAESSSATRVEFANVQYYGWGFANRDGLLPSRQQLDDFMVKVKSAEERLRGKIRVECVVPDYYAKYPKPCMGGWGRKVMLITPSGEALPCHAAGVIPGLHFENVKERSLREIWDRSDAFQRFRGESWMQEPCKSCDRRSQDFGGCRCQALLLAGDAAATDPVCSLSPNRGRVDAILESLRPSDTVPKPIFLYRSNPA
jgi:pyrroloquinoline quinone biosynthesis protein E